MGRRSALRILATAVGILFLAATLFRLVDMLNLIAQPPAGSDTANLVERVEAAIPYRQSIWPVFFATNSLLAFGFVALAGLGISLARQVVRTDDRGTTLLWAFVVAGVLGAVGQIVLVGAVKVSIDVPYCDCGFKNEEIVSQVWAEMVVQGATDVLIQVAALMAAVGIVASAILFGGRAMPSGWRALSYVVAAVVVLTAVLGIIGVGGLDDVTLWLTALLTGVLIPVWAVWLAARFDEGELQEPVQPAR
jgi:hypothetical protein